MQKHYLVYEQNYDCVYFDGIFHSLKDAIDFMKSLDEIKYRSITCTETHEEWRLINYTGERGWRYDYAGKCIFEIPDDLILNYDVKI